MKFWQWIVDPCNRYTNLFTMITVVLSGLISWLISAVYFYKSNRQNLRISVLMPMKQILEDEYTDKNYQRLMEISKEYAAKYMKRRELKVVRHLLDAYKDVCMYNYERICAGILFSYFKSALKQNNVNLKCQPIYVDGEEVALDYPQDLWYMREDLEKVINNYPPEDDAEICSQKVVKVFDLYCRNVYKQEPVSYFTDKSLEGVIEESDETQTWNQKFMNMKCAKEQFYAMKEINKRSK